MATLIPREKINHSRYLYPWQNSGKFSTEETTPIPYPPHHFLVNHTIEQVNHFLVNHNIEQVRCKHKRPSVSRRRGEVGTNVPNIRVTRLSSTRLRAFLGTQDATFRHAARALRLADQRAVRGGDGSSVSVSGPADSRIPGGTAFHLPISSGGLFFDDRFAGGTGSGESLDGEPEEAAADGRRRCLRPDDVVAGMRGRGRMRGAPG